MSRATELLDLDIGNCQSRYSYQWPYKNRSVWSNKREGFIQQWNSYSWNKMMRMATWHRLHCCCGILPGAGLRWTTFVSMGVVGRIYWGGIPLPSSVMNGRWLTRSSSALWQVLFLILQGVHPPSSPKQRGCPGGVAGLVAADPTHGR